MLDNGFVDVPPGKIAAVVTSLQMFERPAPRPEYPRDDWRLRRIERPTAAWYRTIFRRIGEPYLWFSRLRLAEPALQQLLDDDRIEIYTLDEDGEERGLLELDFRESPDCELAFLGLDDTLVGGGAGRWLMNRALDIAWSRPIRRFWVHTCTLDHPKAIPFYERSGFVAYRRQIEIDNDPRLDGTLAPHAALHAPII